MATIKQKLAFKQITEKHRPASVAMREVGYKASTATKPSNLTESKGFLELCEAIGLTDELLTKALVDDIKKKKGNRKAELELGFKVRGRLKENNGGGNITNNLIVIESNQAARIARRAIARVAGSEGSSHRLPDSDESKV